MLITGKYETDSNFVTVYANNTVYTMAKNSREWGAIQIPGRTATYLPLDLNWYKECEAECTETGTFELNDSGHGWKRMKGA